MGIDFESSEFKKSLTYLIIKGQWSLQSGEEWHLMKKLFKFRILTFLFCTSFFFFNFFIILINFIFQIDSSLFSLSIISLIIFFFSSIFWWVRIEILGLASLRSRYFLNRRQSWSALDWVDQAVDRKVAINRLAASVLRDARFFAYVKKLTHIITFLTSLWGIGAPCGT